MLYHVQKKSKQDLISSTRGHRAVSTRSEALQESPCWKKEHSPNAKPGKDYALASDECHQDMPEEAGAAGQQALDAVDGRKGGARDLRRCRLAVKRT